MQDVVFHADFLCKAPPDAQYAPENAEDPRIIFAHEIGHMLHTEHGDGAIMETGVFDFYPAKFTAKSFGIIRSSRLPKSGEY